MITKNDLTGLNDYVKEHFDFVDGDYYWKHDDEGNMPLSIEEVVWFFLEKAEPFL
jgi:hypothetical protein